MFTNLGRIPGSIHTILFAAGQIEDPYWSYNDIEQRSLVNTSWTFSRNFTLTDEMLALDRVELHLTQIDTVATITLNGCPIGQTDSMFVAYAFNVSRTCLSTVNQLQIDFESPVAYATARSQLYNRTIPPLCPPDVQHGECHVQFIRKEPCSFSWDWVSVNLYVEQFHSIVINI
jgi:beta-mannosidase